MTAQAIINKMNDLEMLWCEHNRIDGEHAVKIAAKVKLRVLSFAGNNIDQKNGEKIKKLFICKGYAVI